MAKQDCYLSDSDILSLSLCRLVHLAVAFLSAGYARSSLVLRGSFPPPAGNPRKSAPGFHIQPKQKSKSKEKSLGKLRWEIWLVCKLT